jgi:non-specific protein-tyrosine kinase
MKDQMNLLRTQVLAKLKEIGGNSLLVTSALPREGKTFVSINLAVSLSQEVDRTVLLIDADLKNSSKLHYDFARDFFGIRLNGGLADYLLGQIELPQLLVNPGIEKLTLLPGGRQLPNSAEVLHSPKMKALVEQMKDRYPGDRILIFDSPSLLCADPLILSEFVDGILIVVEEQRTTTKDLKRVINLLKNKTILGTVLNKSRFKDLEYV